MNVLTIVLNPAMTVLMIVFKVVSLEYISFVQIF